MFCQHVDFYGACICKNKVLILICGFCSIEDGEVKIVEGELSKGMLENNKCYLLDRGSEVFVWVGRVTQVEERKAASQTAEVETRHFSIIFWPKRWIFILNFMSRNFFLAKIGQNQHG